MLRVRKERLRRGWTLQDVSNKTGIAKSHLSDVERGIYRIYPGWQKKLAELYQVPVDELFAEVD